jgi:hypothetical protein
MENKQNEKGTNEVDNLLLLSGYEQQSSNYRHNIRHRVNVLSKAFIKYFGTCTTTDNRMMHSLPTNTMLVIEDLYAKEEDIKQMRAHSAELGRSYNLIYIEHNVHVDAAILKIRRCAISLYAVYNDRPDEIREGHITPLMRDFRNQIDNVCDAYHFYTNEMATDNGCPFCDMDNRFPDQSDMEKYVRKRLTKLYPGIRFKAEHGVDLCSEQLKYAICYPRKKPPEIDENVKTTYTLLQLIPYTKSELEKVLQIDKFILFMTELFAFRTGIQNMLQKNGAIPNPLEEEKKTE